MLDFQKVRDAQILAQAIVNTIPEPFLVLDDRFHVLAASRSFYRVFDVDAENTIGHLLYSLGDNQWDIPALRVLLETVIPERAAMEGFEVEHDFPNLGQRVMLLNAREVVYESREKRTILLAFMDITDRRVIELAKEHLHQETGELLAQKGVLLQEMQHRVANSLQIIASILLLKARGVSSEETRQHLKEAHQRVMSVAEIQRHLYLTQGTDQIDVGLYLSKLCDSLASSMIADSQPISVKVICDGGMIDSDKAVSLGLIVTELIINAIKYAFPAFKQNAAILVTYEISGADWHLTVADNGVGKAPSGDPNKIAGLGTAIVDALVKKLNAVMETVCNSEGMKISISRSTFVSRITPLS
jgi:chemotaxis protein methyltransferase CheR